MQAPRASRETVLSAAAAAMEKLGLSPLFKTLPCVFMVAVRGYRAATMGPTPGNDVGIYDDAFFLITPGGMVPQNANTDPSRLGWNPGVGKPFGLLQPGIWQFYPGPHKGRLPAFRQADDEETGLRLGFRNAGRFAVLRCWGPGDSRNKIETGWQQVNIHPGGNTGTSSWLCLTVPKEEADHFLSAVTRALRDHGVNHLEVVLIEGPIV